MSLTDPHLYFINHYYQATHTNMIALKSYDIEETLGSGGMASVYKGRQLSLDRPVAIKVLDATLIEDPLVQAQFQQESRLIASLNHPNIIHVIDQGNLETGQPYFVMQYVKGIPLNTIISREDISNSRKLDIVIQICKALSYAHKNGVVHRDIKPANVLVDFEGYVRLLDFGIAGYFQRKGVTLNGKQASKAVVMGTPEYMSPEQARSSELTSPVSDIYSLGVMMHELFTGSIPGSNSTLQKALPSSLMSIIEQCLEVDPDKRPQNTELLRQQLLLVSAGSHIQAQQWQNKEQNDTLDTQFELLDIIKENRFGASYLVRKPGTKKLLVVKKQQLKFSDRALVVNKALSALDHQNIVKIYGTASNERVFITVSEYVMGGSLQDRLSQTIEIDQWLSIARQLCEALDFCHSKNIIHGNIRPSNILQAAKNHIKITDAGFLDHSVDDKKDWYQPANEQKSALSDIYSVGVVLFRIISDQLPIISAKGVDNINTFAIKRPISRHEYAQ